MATTTGLERTAVPDYLKPWRSKHPRCPECLIEGRRGLMRAMPNLRLGEQWGVVVTVFAFYKCLDCRNLFVRHGCRLESETDADIKNWGEPEIAS